MTIQLLVGIAILYTLGWLPTVLTQIVQFYFDHSFLVKQLEFVLFLIYFLSLLLSAVCLHTVSNLMKRLRSLVTRHSQKANAIQMPQQEISNRPINNSENIKN
jgi:hypothetical protein